MTATGAAKFKSIDEFLKRFQRVKQTGANEWTASCPCETHKHGDRSRSLSIKLNNDKILLHCFIEDTAQAIVGAAGLTPAHLFLDPHRNGTKPHEVCAYSYTDEGGRELYQNVRLEPKNFFHRRMVNGKWKTKNALDGARRVPYHLPAIMLGGGVLCFAEGEKDADTLTAQGFRATNSKNWCAEWTELLPPNTSAVVFRDRDAAGEKIATACAGLLWGKVASLKIVELPGTAHDISDWFAAGGTADALRGLIELTPEWVNAPKASEAENDIELESFREVKATHLVYSWPGYLPLGVLAHVAGKSTQAKSPLWLDVAARISTGKEFPNGAANKMGPRSVLLLTAEDDPADTIKPRLELAGADVGKIFRVKASLRDGQTTRERMFSLATDLQKLSAAIAQLGDVVLVVIDPITNYLSGGNSGGRMNAEEDMRALLMPLVEAARARKFTAVTVGHLNRREKGTDPLFRIMGAAAFSGVARFVYLCGPDPDDAENKYAHVMVQRRGVDAPSLRYKTFAQDVTWDGATSPVVGITWCGTSSATAEDAVDAENISEQSEVARAAKRLAAMIRESKAQRVAVKDAKEQLAEMGLDTEVLNWGRILRTAKVESKKFAGEKFYSVFLPAGNDWFPS